MTYAYSIVFLMRIACSCHSSYSTFTLYTAVPAMASGKDSPQYKIVQNNFDNIVDTLKSNTAAHHALRRILKSQKWLVVHDEPTEEKLVSVILNRIELDASVHSVFMDMLQDTDGMDLIAKKLQLPGRTISLYILL